ncbi:MAG: hypothetical protein A2271_01335 [Candidatus Moranbacteria bacterium RIFOXYA12_FULL_35_19]|nr:MAG: hypothetical protein UR78_C0007G0030 [Candidatus Moranbacteria bacterium GW2011_GWF2_35_39]OGI32395.1 MAG: hypothetical protein A2343_03905 [Candidatus Moranbacteria bacterium RIFOXYB12_FULL_35_8]OGI32664.1 MAG: hypothetical protein A2489_00365 [Candidatus Moranbacteria bacterium RIFOXYC12_FULL_36_13]OGI35619.1 MAG: hypothetical protein A2271_01335 [Candidatus Moranbacteria bacterium RIFOXYA12_FULL_35_19]
MKKPRRGTVIFFPPDWLTNFSLLEKFFHYLEKRYERVLIFNKNFSENSFRKMTAPVIGISYSSGDEDMVNFVSKFPQNFSRAIMIAPTGTCETVPSFAKHCSLFIWEIMKLVWRRKFKVAWKVVIEAGDNFLFHPFISFREVEKNRRYRLFEEIIIKIYLKVDFAFIFPLRDDFLPIADLPPIVQERFIAESRSCGHFGFLEMPGYYWKLFRDL